MKHIGGVISPRPVACLRPAAASPNRTTRSEELLEELCQSLHGRRVAAEACEA